MEFPFMEKWVGVTPSNLDSNCVRAVSRRRRAVTAETDARNGDVAGF